jgi:hypothetical protein
MQTLEASKDSNGYGGPWPFYTEASFLAFNFFEKARGSLNVRVGQQFVHFSRSKI